MRFRFKPSSEQRSRLRAQMARLQQPAAALEILRSVLPADFEPTGVTCTLQSVHSDRFVMRVQMRADAGEQRQYALKVYSDDFAQAVWRHARSLAHHHQPKQNGLCLPTRFIHDERMLIFPWVDGRFLSEIVDERKPELMRQAARVAADLHRLDIVPEALTTAQMIVDETRARCERLSNRWSETAPILEPLMAILQEASSALDPVDPAPVHGDLAAGQYLWTGDRLVLLDLDMFGYTDPSYDAGHFLAQLERRSLVDPTVRAQTPRWLDSFREAYFAAMPKVSPRNVSFYHGLTLIRKIYTICRRQPAEWSELVPQIADHARAALEEVVSPMRN